MDRPLSYPHPIYSARLYMTPDYYNRPIAPPEEDGRQPTLQERIATSRHKSACSPWPVTVGTTMALLRAYSLEKKAGVCSENLWNPRAKILSWTAQAFFWANLVGVEGAEAESMILTMWERSRIFLVAAIKDRGRFELLTSRSLTRIQCDCAPIRGVNSFTKYTRGVNCVSGIWSRRKVLSSLRIYNDTLGGSTFLMWFLQYFIFNL
ncbi:hypothetical protein DFJ43DRAFT_1044765 [Lentinula guzmanii]|uniref:Uncharacterized protein n=1 Tax=Lentinula guzmanii TaxID=2804957 RepID=A0AA38J0Y7_9AGAR|nr:hypothetical protein DFJ43DRAFT_1044765 [Lentinula guzmanii]